LKCTPPRAKTRLQDSRPKKQKTINQDHERAPIEVIVLCLL